MLIVPGTANAAVPVLGTTWSVIPTTVQSADYVAMRASIRNNDTSTVSQLYLVEVAPRDPNLTYHSINTSQGSCNTSGATFVCTLGQLKPNKTATVTVVFKTAATTTSYVATEHWEFNTTGLGSGGGDNSHGDSWPSVGSNGAELLAVNVTASGDFGGRYVLNSSLNIVENNQALSNSNAHSTRAYSPVTGIGVTVEDIVCDGVDDDALCADLSAGFGQVSKVNVNDGSTAGALLHFYLQFDSSEIPNGVNANNIEILHSFGGTTYVYSTDCTFAKKATTPNNAPCIVPKSLPGGDIGVDVWTFHNGGLRGNF